MRSPVDSASPDDLVRMRAFVADLANRRQTSSDPPADLVRRNGLAPLAYRAGLAAFRAEYAANTILADRRARLMASLAAAMHRREVRFALIKGIAYAGRIYPDPAERPMDDIDLLVPPEQLDEATDAMREIGFRRGGSPRNLSPHYHELLFVGDDSVVELHRNIVQPGRSRLRLDEVWARATPDPLLPGASRLDAVDDLLFCLLNIARNELTAPVINYIDASRLWLRLDAAGRTQLDGRARDYRVTRAVTAALSMTHLFLQGRPGRASVRIGRLLPTTDDILVRATPHRLRQLARKALLTQGPRELLGLAYSQTRATLDGWLRR